MLSLRLDSRVTNTVKINREMKKIKQLVTLSPHKFKP